MKNNKFLNIFFISILFMNFKTHIKAAEEPNIKLLNSTPFTINYFMGSKTNAAESEEAFIKGRLAQSRFVSLAPKEEYSTKIDTKYIPLYLMLKDISTQDWVHIFKLDPKPNTKNIYIAIDNDFRQLSVRPQTKLLISLKNNIGKSEIKEILSTSYRWGFKSDWDRYKDKISTEAGRKIYTELSKDKYKELLSKLTEDQINYVLGRVIYDVAKMDTKERADLLNSINKPGGENAILGRPTEKLTGKYWKLVIDAAKAAGV